MKKLEVFAIFLVVLVYFSVRFYVLKYLSIQGVYRDDIFILSLLGRSSTFPWYLTQVFDFGNLILIYLIGRKVLSNNVGLLSSLIYSLSPWTIYISLAGSINIIILFWLMLSFLGILILKIDKRKYAVFLVVLGISVAICLSLTIVFVLPVFLYLLIKFKFLDILTRLEQKVLLVFTLVFAILFLVLVTKNIIGFQNILSRYINLFSDIGLINSVNDFRGLSEKVGFPLVGKLVENKVTYLGRHALFNSLAQFTPTTYFTPQEKLLGFSFSPPVLFGFIFPFFLGLREIFKKVKKTRALFILSFALTIPSILSKDSPDLARLILLSPLMFYSISLGLVNGFKSPKRLTRMIMYGVILLVLVQGVVILSDISFREPLRYEKFLKK